MAIKDRWGLRNPRSPRGPLLGLACLLLAGPCLASSEALFITYEGRATIFSNRPVGPSSTALRKPKGPLSDLVSKAAQRHGLDANLVRAVIHVESGFNAKARSSAGAIGLMQVMPTTGARFGVTDLRDEELNLEAGCRYLAHLLQLFRGDVSLALAAYNAGEGAVIKNGYRIPPYDETQRYVPAVLSRWAQLRRSLLSGDSRTALR